MSVCPKCKKQELRPGENLCPHCKSKKANFLARAGEFAVATAALIAYALRKKFTKD